MNKFVGLKCLTETKIQILYDHVDYTRFHIVEMGCQMVQHLSAYIVRPTMFVKLTPAKVNDKRSNRDKDMFQATIFFSKLRISLQILTMA